MMNIRVVLVGMGDWLMHMWMVVGVTRWIKRTVFVLMMVVVDMPMRMNQSLMSMQVTMLLE
jgi:hypothetical protein